MVRHRNIKEINQAILTAIKNGNRSVRDIALSSDVMNHSMTKRYLQELIKEGKVKEVEPTSFDHKNVKTCFVLRDDMV